MSFVKTPEEIERIEDALATVHWTGEWISAQFLTREDVVARILPPPLQPAPEPLASVTVGLWRSSCLGSWAGGVLNLEARHDGIDGHYVLVIYMDSEHPIAFGRELFGEPKKMAKTELLRDGDHVHGRIERHGVCLIDIDAHLDTDLGPLKYERHTFNYKSRTAAGGRGLEEDAILTRTRFDVELKQQRTGSGTVVLGRGVHDPLADVEIVQVRRIVYGEDASTPRCTPAARVPAEQFLPYHYGRQDDWLALDTLQPPSSVTG